jgi:hypothetical protein
LGAAVAQPFHDLNLGNEDAPDVLSSALIGTYRAPRACAAADAEIQALDDVLGPRPQAGTGLDPTGLASSALKSVWSLPFRGIVRQLSGAERHDRAQAIATRAGLLRRGYLQGWRADRCPSQPPSSTAAGGTSLGDIKGRAGADG